MKEIENSGSKAHILKNSRPSERLVNTSLSYCRILAQARISRPSERPETTGLSYWTILAQARISRPSEYLSPKRETKSLKGKATEDQLQFNPEIEKSAKSNRKKAKAKKKQGAQLESQFSRPGEVEPYARPPYWLILAQARVSGELNPPLIETTLLPKSIKLEPMVKPTHPTTVINSPQWKGRSVTTLSFNGLLSLSEGRNEYPEFLTRLDELKWGTLASPHNKFDPDVVREFYANAYPPEEGGGLFEHKSWVRGKVIRYDREYLNLMLNNPYEMNEDSLDGYHRMVELNSTMVHGFRIAETVVTLCLPGRSVSANVDGQPKRIYRKGMTTLAQIWMIFCLHNIIPNSHVSSLPLSDCHLLCCIIEGVEIDVTRLMATKIYKTAVKGGKRNNGIPVLNYVPVCKARSYG
ncbi:hypothetical protein Lal_00018475 [Lupinus albus]|nr:hypothetical protein Lal_00018475 [Lupinus albus]